jgi:hypothetical protein
LKVEPARGLVCSGISKPRRISAFNGPAAGGGYVLRTGLKVKVAGGPFPAWPIRQGVRIRPQIQGGFGAAKLEMLTSLCPRKCRQWQNKVKGTGPSPTRRIVKHHIGNLPPMPGVLSCPIDIKHRPPTIFLKRRSDGANKHSLSACVNQLIRREESRV